MKQDKFDPKKNYDDSKKAIGYVARKDAVQADYDRVGFKAGLEVHQQLKTKQKLFCRCPAGIYNGHDDYDAEIIRHMRPTLSELGEYDGTALMEFKTRKTIIYRIKNETACTYDIDDTPPFPINREALKIALEVSLLCKLNIVGEVHIIRKQYLDGSIPTGFQRTAILGVEGEIQLKNKKVRLIQLSVEEDSCREISDIGHVRIYQTDRLGMPLIETVTYPDFSNPDEIREGAEYIRFLNRSTGKVNTGIGSGREDVNVSCRGGTRIEIKGVSHNKWIPDLTHNEVFRQWALLRIKDLLNERKNDSKKRKISHGNLSPDDPHFTHDFFSGPREKGFSFIGINLPGFKGILSHFTQPGKMFADEISDRLKVIACIEKPNLLHSEQLDPILPDSFFEGMRIRLQGKEGDAQLLVFGPPEDISTALETVEERCDLAFNGVPRESRKSFEDGTTIFERVLPGADRMYPDTDSAPIPLDDEYIEKIRKRLPPDVAERLSQLRSWHVPEDTYVYILRNNLVPLMERVHHELDINPRFLGVFLGHKLKNIQGRFPNSPDFTYEKIFDLFEFIKKQDLDLSIAPAMLPEVYRHPNMDLDSVLTTINFRRVPREEILAQIPYLKKKYAETSVYQDNEKEAHWVMGELRSLAVGNIPLFELKTMVEKNLRNSQ
ncbi:MAG: Glu-tRNA(Gln) amidotransferase subunit GatE [Candidatus Aminicenantes bacterium]|nr:Glu-tRNA(Gln) amidotransferase subunit GatE [Candidatus Aminicenantes bacterium]